MKCIKCGYECEWIRSETELLDILIGYRCPICNLKWSTAVHIDDMTYCIQQIDANQHQIHLLQQENEQLKIQIQILQDALNQLLQKFGV